MPMQGLGKTVSIIALILSNPGGPRRDRPLRRDPESAALLGDAADGAARDAAALERASSMCEGGSGAPAPAAAVPDTGVTGAEEEPRAATLQAGEADHGTCVRLAQPAAAGEAELKFSDRVAGDLAAEDAAAPGVPAAAQKGFGQVLPLQYPKP